MKEQEDYFKGYIEKNNMPDGMHITEFASSVPTVIELTDSQLELIKNNGNAYYSSSDTYYSLPFYFKHIEGNKFEMILIINK